MLGDEAVVYHSFRAVAPFGHNSLNSILSPRANRFCCDTSPDRIGDCRDILSLAISRFDPLPLFSREMAMSLDDGTRLGQNAATIVRLFGE